MKQTFITLLTLLWLPGLSQSTDELDKTNGFRQFKFGKAPTEFKSLILDSTAKVKQRNVKNYFYKGEDITEIHGVRIRTIELSFFNNRLYQVMVTFGTIDREYTIDEQAMIVSSLRRSFGTTTHDCKRGTTTSTKVLDCTVWDGRKVKLEHLRIDFDSNKTEKGVNSIWGYVLFTEKEIQKEQDSSEVDW